MGKASAPDWLSTRAVLEILGSRKAQYRAFVEQGGDDEVGAFFNREYHGPILGSAEFVKRALRGYRPNHEQPRRRKLQTKSGMAEVLQAVGREYGVSTDELRHTARGRGQRNLPRAVAMHLCQTLGQKKLGEIAAYFNVSHYATVSVTIKRLKDDMESDRGLVQRIHAIEARLQ